MIGEQIHTFLCIVLHLNTHDNLGKVGFKQVLLISTLFRFFYQYLILFFYNSNYLCRLIENNF